MKKEFKDLHDALDEQGKLYKASLEVIDMEIQLLQAKRRQVAKKKLVYAKILDALRKENDGRLVTLLKTLEGDLLEINSTFQNELRRTSRERAASGSLSNPRKPLPVGSGQTV